MNIRLVAVLSVLLSWGLLAGAPAAHADILELKDGSKVEGIIRGVENGQVTMEVNQQTRTFSILDVVRMEFDTPHLPEGSSRLPVEHFLRSMEAQDMVEHLLAVERSATELRALIEETKREWAGRSSIPRSEVPQWEAAKERVHRALLRHQEYLGDLYFHIVGKVNEYNELTKEGNQLYVGVEGALRAGSPLISDEMAQLPLRRFVPMNWYETIYFSGYRTGYNEGYYGARPREFVAPQ